MPTETDGRQARTTQLLAIQFMREPNDRHFTVRRTVTFPASPKNNKLGFIMFIFITPDYVNFIRLPNN